MAKQIVDARGGSIHAETALGAGSTVTFPLKRADRAAAKEDLQ